jgi:hypothetical protein
MERGNDEYGFYAPRLVKVRRRRRLASAIGWLFFPLFFVTAVLGNTRSAWWWLPGGLLMLLQQYFALRGYLQRCPRCRDFLVVQRWWGREMPAACPSCGLAIDDRPL